MESRRFRCDFMLSCLAYGFHQEQVCEGFKRHAMIGVRMFETWFDDLRFVELWTSKVILHEFGSYCSDM